MGFGTFAKLAARRTTAPRVSLLFLFIFFSLYFFASLSSAYSLRLISPASLNATLEYNDSASVSLSSSFAGCGEAIQATVKANGSFYKKMFLQGTATAVRWQGECGFVRGHCGYNALSISNASTQLFFSQSPPCLQLEDFPADFSGTIAAENSTKDAQIYFSAFETHGFDSEQWGLPVSISSFSALLLREQKIAFSGNSSLENSTLSTTLQVVPAKTGNLFAVLSKGATQVSFKGASGNALPFSFNAQTGAFQAGVVAGTRHFLSFAGPSVNKLNFSVATASNATPFFPPLFKAIISGTGGLKGGCALSEMPPDARKFGVKNAFGKTVSFGVKGGSVSWDCDFFPSPNYSISFESGNPLPPSALSFPQNFVVISAVESVSPGAAAGGAGSRNESAGNASGGAGGANSSSPSGQVGVLQNSSNSSGQNASGNYSGSTQPIANNSAGFGSQNFSGNFSQGNDEFQDGWHDFESGLDENGVPTPNWKKRAFAFEEGFGNESEEGAGVEGEIAGGVFGRGRKAVTELGGSAFGNKGMDGQNQGSEGEGVEGVLLGGVHRENNGNGDLGEVVGLAFSSLASPFNALAFAALAALAAIAFARGRRGALRVSKKLVGGKVCLLVENNSKCVVSNVALSDFIPERGKAGGFSEMPEFSETVLGRKMQWKKAALGVGEPWRVEYSLEGEKKEMGKEGNDEAAKCGRARVSGVSEKGEKLLAEGG